MVHLTSVSFFTSHNFLPPLHTNFSTFSLAQKMKRVSTTQHKLAGFSQIMPVVWKFLPFEGAKLRENVMGI